VDTVRKTQQRPGKATDPWISDLGHGVSEPKGHQGVSVGTTLMLLNGEPLMSLVLTTV